MSGICGIFHVDGAPVELAILQSMTDFLAFRGPDRQQTWYEGAVGFGHTLLRTTFESEHEQQPATFDGQVWITADARIDGWAELKAALAKAGQVVASQATDAALILHAYLAWGDECVQHLIGDFAFAIWDGRRQRLFCARDHFGVKPFFYAKKGQCIIFSNTLDAIRQHPLVSATLNDLAIADFLLFGRNQEPDTTSFIDIRRLPPAHTLLASAEGVATKEYWTLPANVTVRYRPEGDYVAEFKRLLDAAVADRLRTDRVGVELSGGLDSGALAATAKDLLLRSGRPYQLNAHTVVYDRLIPDRERYFSQLTAKALDIPQRVFAADDYQLFERHEEVVARTPEPFHDPTMIRYYDTLDSLPPGQRVVLAGWDGDALLNESPKPYFRELLRSRRYLRLLADVAGYALWQRRFFPLSWRDWLRRKWKAPAAAKSAYPAWIQPELEKRLELRQRFDDKRQSTPRHDFRPAALEALALIKDSSTFFELFDTGHTRLPMEFRHPLMDLRIIEYCLSLPPYPWCIKKHLLRESFRGILPEPVRRRPKALLAGHPHHVLMQGPEAWRLDGSLANETLGRYIDASRIPADFGGDDPGATWINLRPHSLAYWLSHELTTSQQHKG